MAGEDGPRKRRRPAQSCEQCRQRKVRCDRNVPCGPCTRARSDLHCSYRDKSPSPNSNGIEITTPGTAQRPVTAAFNPRPPNPLTPTDIGDTDLQSKVEIPLRDIRYRLQSLEDRLTALTKNSQPPWDDRRLEQALHDLTEKTQSIERKLGATQKPGDQTHENGYLTVKDIPRRLHVAAGKTKLLGPTHWIHKVDKVWHSLSDLLMRELNELQLQVVESLSGRESEASFKELKADLTKVVKECRGLRKSIKSHRSVTVDEPVPDLRSTIPPKAVCDELVQGYLRTFELIYRVVHIPVFWEGYTMFWTEPQLSPTSFLMKLILILTIGTAFHEDNINGINNQFTHLKQKWVYAAQWWLTGPSAETTASLEGLQVFCLLLTARKVSGLGTSHVLSANSLVEMAMRLGLHIDPSKFPNLSPYECEMRVRLWATVLELALQSSLESGLPCRLPLEFGTRPPFNLDDHDINPNTSQIPSSKPSEQWTDASFLSLLQESVKLRMEVIQLISSLGEKSYQRALKFSADMRLACRRLTNFAQSCTASLHRQGTGPTDFHKQFLDMELRRYILALHAPFTVQARKDPRFYYSRKVSLESAMAIASYAYNLDLPSNPLDDFSRMTLVATGSFKGPLGLDIISVLGLEVVTQLEEESSVESLLGPEDEIAKVARTPIIRTLEHILNQLLQIISFGSPSLKRYNFLAAILAQIRAMESNQCVKRVVYETVKSGLQECYALLQSSTAGLTGSTIPGMPNGTAVENTLGLPDPTLAEFGFQPVVGLPVEEFLDIF
ncbi:C6 zinc finger protein [Aspergillus mulundensis]|uniref:C6 zinc finger protein n=1 Tax=Aspergillus mulundensis TaxID=1810919 RepID=A0A3D8RYV9_9EURO|nr:C6 zinc finger protein [Aspergillus mulundensis]RDW79247.1 C6 zinc finger protein [Aspergillus mulundensis]